MGIWMPSLENIPWTELEKFASYFHQDIIYLKEDVHEMGRQYISSLPSEKRVALKLEIADLLSKHESPKALLKAWHAKGAEAWDRKVDLRSFLEGISKALE